MNRSHERTDRHLLSSHRHRERQCTQNQLSGGDRFHRSLHLELTGFLPDSLSHPVMREATSRWLKSQICSLDGVSFRWEMAPGGDFISRLEDNRLSSTRLLVDPNPARTVPTDSHAKTWRQPWPPRRSALSLRMDPPVLEHRRTETCGGFLPGKSPTFRARRQRRTQRNPRKSKLWEAFWRSKPIRNAEDY